MATPDHSETDCQETCWALLDELEQYKTDISNSIECYESAVGLLVSLSDLQTQQRYGNRSGRDFFIAAMDDDRFAQRMLKHMDKCSKPENNHILRGQLDHWNATQLSRMNHLYPAIEQSLLNNLPLIYRNPWEVFRCVSHCHT
jgi:hypothetical protein